jgi:hypothetical protein
MYFGHDSKNRKFAVIVTFSEKERDVDEQWIEKQVRPYL